MINDQRIQDKMIALAEEADEEYGRRLREGLESMKKEHDANPLGAKDADKVSKETMDDSHDADPY